MKANELRIGNWVKYGIEYVKICSIHEDDILDSFIPIELTADLLEKLDIKKINQTLFDKVQFGKECYYDISELRLIYKNKSFYHAITGQDIKIKYLHQLQNLYFALSSKELEIELWKTSKTS